MDGINIPSDKWGGKFGDQNIEFELSVANSTLNGRAKIAGQGGVFECDGTVSDEGLIEIQFQSSTGYIAMHGKVTSKKTVVGVADEFGERELKINFELKISDAAFKRKKTN